MNRKTLFCFLTALIMIFVLAGCSGKNSGGNIDNVQIPDWKPSEIYSDSDIGMVRLIRIQHMMIGNGF